MERRLWNLERGPPSVACGGAADGARALLGLLLDEPQEPTRFAQAREHRSSVGAHPRLGYSSISLVGPGSDRAVASAVATRPGDRPARDWPLATEDGPRQPTPDEADERRARAGYGAVKGDA